MTDHPIISGTVLLAGINPATGTPQIIDSTVLAAGLDPDGVPHVLSVDEDGNLGGGSLTSEMNQLVADVTMTNANQDYDGPSISLGEGTWLVVASVHFHNNVAGANSMITKLFSGATLKAAGEASVPASGVMQQTLTAIIVLIGTTTVKATVRSTGTGGLIKAATTTGSATGASTLSALKVA